MNDRSPPRRGTEFGLQVCSDYQALRLPLIGEDRKNNMANRKGVFIGAYVPNELKESLRRRAAAEHRTLSQEITRILVEAVHGKGLPAGSVDRRDTTAIPRRRSTDPPTRRRAEDLPYINNEGDKK